MECVPHNTLAVPEVGQDNRPRSIVSTIQSHSVQLTHHSTPLRRRALSISQGPDSFSCVCATSLRLADSQSGDQLPVTRKRDDRLQRRGILPSQAQTRKTRWSGATQQNARIRRGTLRRKRIDSVYLGLSAVEAPPRRRRVFSNHV